MPKSTTPRPPGPQASRRMTAVHALGHPSSPPPMTRWSRPGRGPGSEAPVPAAIPPPPTSFSPNTPGAASLAQGSGSDLMVSWTAPPVDGTHNAATAIALRSSPSGAGTWTVVANVTSPYDLSGLTPGAAFDVQLQASNAAGPSAWSVTSTLTTASAGPYAPNAPSITSVVPPPDGPTRSSRLPGRRPRSMAHTARPRATIYGRARRTPEPGRWYPASPARTP